MDLKTIDERVAKLVKDNPVLRVATYNKLLFEYYKTYEGLVLPDWFVTLPSAESITRVFRKHKISDYKKEQEFIKQLRKIK